MKNKNFNKGLGLTALGSFWWGVLGVIYFEHISFVGAFFIGLMQAISLVPGTSRAGITMTAARFLGVERQDAARFSLLLSIPTIIGAGVLKGYELSESTDRVLFYDVLTVTGLSFLFVPFLSLVRHD